MLHLALPLAALALFAGGGALSIWLQRRRARLCLEQAQSLGFAPLIDRGWASVFALPHPLFKRGRGGAVRWAAEGSADGLPARLLDYEYTTGYGRNRRTYRQTVAAFRLAQAAMPAFEMHPERWYHQLAELIGYSDIDFEGFDAFSDHYRLLGPDEPAIRAFFGPALLSALGARLGWTVEGAGQTLLVYRPASTVAPDGLRDFLALSRDVAGAFCLR